MDTGADMDIDFSAETYDTDGSIEKVEFLLMKDPKPDCIPFTDKEEPHAYSRVNPYMGKYRVYARVTDNDGCYKECRKANLQQVNHHNIVIKPRKASSPEIPLFSPIMKPVPEVRELPG